VATLIRVKASGGKRARVCNAQCYNAKFPTCVCVCGGKNHGVGLERAKENTREIAEELLSKGYWIAKEVAHAHSSN